jgi:hypothetical protein
LYELAKEALQFGERALTLETFARGDYRKLCEMLNLKKKCDYETP